MSEKPKINLREINPKKNKTLVILHGWNTVGSGSWEGILDLFRCSDFRVLAPDMPGFGLSEAPTEVWQVKDYAKWLNEFLEQNKIKAPIYLLGHSFGGAIAAEFASQNPEKLQKLFLVAPAIVRRPSNFKQKIIKKFTKIIKKIFQLPVAKNLSKPVKKIWYKLLGSQDYNQSQGIMKKIMQKIIRQDLQYLLPKIKVETVLIWGTKDKYTPYADHNLVLKKIPKCKFIKLKRINHGVHLHAAQKLVEEIIAN